MIKSIDAYEGIGPSVYLYCISNNIPEEDMIRLMALFDRYQLDNFNQLEIFKNKENEDIF